MIRILHLEDDANDAELIAMHLHAQTDAQYDITRVVTQNEFTAALDRTQFDVILADNAGPQFNRNDVLAIARTKQPQAVFLFLSGDIERPHKTTTPHQSDGKVAKDRLEDLGPAIQRALQNRPR